MPTKFLEKVRKLHSKILEVEKEIKYNEDLMLKLEKIVFDNNFGRFPEHNLKEKNYTNIGHLKFHLYNLECYLNGLKKINKETIDTVKDIESILSKLSPEDLEILNSIL